jgi:hypothetical protein
MACMRRPEARDGDWRLLAARPAWNDNPTWERFVTFGWSGRGRRLLVAVNYGPTQGQCYLNVPDRDLAGRKIILSDLMNPTITYERDGGDLVGQGLYLDMPAWGYHVFDVTPTP